MQNPHPASSTQQAEQSWLKTRAESKACQSIFLKLTKDDKQLDKNLELAGWYQTVPYLRLESHVKRHIATKSYLSAD
jgi:cell division FtsZ-interacting protein ZapD